MSEIFKRVALVGDVWVLWLLLLASIFSLAVVIERVRVFWKSKVDYPKFIDTLSEQLENGNLIAAKKLLRHSQGFETRVAEAGVDNIFRGYAAVEEAMTSRLVLEKSRLEKNLIILGTLGNNAPFLGLFGTVLGIIKAFNDLALTGQSGVSVVMAGISTALVATALGILVAIPAVVAYNYFLTRIKETQSEVESLAHLVLSAIKR